jgi:hypothetical protein
MPSYLTDAHNAIDKGWLAEQVSTDNVVLSWQGTHYVQYSQILCNILFKNFPLYILHALFHRQYVKLQRKLPYVDSIRGMLLSSYSFSFTPKGHP